MGAGHLGSDLAVFQFCRSYFCCCVLVMLFTTVPIKPAGLRTLLAIDCKVQHDLLDVAGEVQSVLYVRVKFSCLSVWVTGHLRTPSQFQPSFRPVAVSQYQSDSILSPSLRFDSPSFFPSPKST